MRLCFHCVRYKYCPLRVQWKSRSRTQNCTVEVSKPNLLMTYLCWTTQSLALVATKYAVSEWLLPYLRLLFTLSLCFSCHVNTANPWIDFAVFVIFLWLTKIPWIGILRRPMLDYNRDRRSCIKLLPIKFMCILLLLVIVFEHIALTVTVWIL